MEVAMLVVLKATKLGSGPTSNGGFRNNITLCVVIFAAYSLLRRSVVSIIGL
jgi:hypothetical protein